MFNGAAVHGSALFKPQLLSLSCIYFTSIVSFHGVPFGVFNLEAGRW